MAISTLFKQQVKYADRVFTRTWLALWSLLGRWRPKAALDEPGRENVMVIAPHPDDEALGCAGTIMRHLERGAIVTIVIVTDGRMSRARRVSGDEMAAIRKNEATAAAQAIGATAMRWLGLEEGAWDREQLRGRLADLMAECGPDIVYAPCRLDYHPEHRRVAAVLASVIPAGTRVRIYTLHVPLRGLVNRRVDVTRQMPRIAECFEIYETQRLSLLRGLRLRQYAAALNRCPGAVEEFVEVAGEKYREAHVSDAPLAGVWGMRYWSVADPLCYIRGQHGRREFAGLLALDRDRET